MLGPEPRARSATVGAMTATPVLWVVRALLVAFVVVLGGAGQALAHTELESADPEPDAEVDALERIELIYAGPLSEDGDHEIGLFDGDARLDTGDTEMEDDRTIVADVLGPVPAGELVVRWVIVAADGDEQRGDYQFTLTQAVAETSTTPPVTQTSPPMEPPTPTEPPPTDEASPPVSTPTPTASPSSDSQGGGSISPTALGLIGLGTAAASGAVVVALRRRS